MRVLLIEDDVTTSAKIEVVLQNEGIVCDVADLGEDGFQQGKLYDSKRRTTAALRISSAR
jgi:DNA-binding response OmpR family regulator